MSVIIGLDLSMNGSGCVKFELDENYEIVNKDYLAFTSVKKNKSENILYFHKNDFKDSLQKASWMSDKIVDFCKDGEYIAIEDYSYASRGLVFNIAEFTGIIKYRLLQENKKLRLYDIPSIKMFATGTGNADKSIMEKHYKKLFETNEKEMFDLSHLAEFKSPRMDVEDSWFIAKLLHTEILLRKGLLKVKELPDYKIRIFNRVTKSNPVNVLDRDFMEVDNEK